MSHAGNWNRNPRKLALERQREAEREAAEAYDPLIAPGWRRDRYGVWWPILTASAMVLRGAEAKGFCKTDECRRNVSVDLGWWCSHGLGDEDIRDLLQGYRCARQGCRLGFGEEKYPAGRPVIDLTGGLVHRVQIRCRRCEERGLWLPEEFANYLRTIRVGDGNTPIVAAASRMAVQPCPFCKESDWRVDAWEPSWSPATDEAIREQASSRARAAARMLCWPEARRRAPT